MLNNRDCCIMQRASLWTRESSRAKAMRAVATARRMPPGQMDTADAAALKKLAKQAGEAARLLKLLGNEKRLLILCFLSGRGGLTVGGRGGGGESRPAS